MIKNQKQAGQTKEKLTELKKAKKEFEGKKNDYDEATYDLGLKSIDALIKELEQELETYESLTKGNFHCFKPDSLLDIPQILISARLAEKKSHEELGKLIGVKHQQIQRYEATDYETAAWPRIIEVATALRLKFYFEKVIIMTNKDEPDFKIPENISKDQMAYAEESVFKNGLFTIN